MGDSRGLTLLEVVIALLLFAMISVMLLSGQSGAARAAERAQVARDMSELLALRLNLIALQPDDYESGEQGWFPATGKSSRILDEEKVFGERYEGYRWEVQIEETIGSGTTQTASIGGSEPRNLLFAEEGSATEATESAEVEPEEVDRLLLIQVTIYPPGYEESHAGEEGWLQPRMVWTAIPLPEEEASE
ncbi:MAG: type II secretion system protein [Planctomycetes bacterium]|nr:type II secretion system protein [Planctomycetota bacterium]